MNTPTEQFELSSTTLRGATVSVSYHHAQAILRSEQMNPEVAFEVYATEEGVVSGMNEVLYLLSNRLPAASSGVLSLSDGDRVASGETVLSVIAPYATFGLYSQVITGVLASNTGWATAADECVKAAGGIRVAIDGAGEMHPEVIGAMQYSAHIGGCVAVSSEEGGNLTNTTPQGSMSHDFVLLWGAADRAITLFDRQMRLGVQRVMPVPTTGDVVQEALDAAYALGGAQSNPLRAVRLDVPSNLGRGSPQLAIELKARLVDAGFHSVDIHVAGDLNPDSIAGYVEANAPVSLFIVDRYIATAPSIKFAGAIKEIEGRSVAPRGMSPGRQPNGRMSIRV